MVRVTGVEPAREAHQILSLARLPIPPYPRVAPATRGYAIAGTKYIFYYKREKIKCQDESIAPDPHHECDTGRWLVPAAPSGRGRATSG